MNLQESLQSMCIFMHAFNINVSSCIQYLYVLTPATGRRARYRYSLADMDMSRRGTPRGRLSGGDQSSP